MSVDSILRQLNNNKFGKIGQNLRRVTIAVEAIETVSAAVLNASFVKREVEQALIADGFSLVNVNVNETFRDWSIIIVCNVYPQFTDEQVRQRIQFLLSKIQTHTDYGITTSNSYYLFQSVVAQIVGNIQTKITQVDYEKDSYTNTDFLKDFALGTGFSLTTLAIIGITGLVIYKKIL